MKTGKPRVVENYLAFHQVDEQGKYNGWSGYTLLGVAAREGNSVALQKLLAADANVNLRSAWGYMLLIVAAGWGKTDAVRLLLDNPDTHINAESNSGWTALGAAKTEGHTGVIYLLEQRGAVCRSPFFWVC